MADRIPQRVRVAKAMPEYGLRAGQAAWVAGSGVQKLIDEGALVDINGRVQRNRLWKVGGTTYPDYKLAQRVAKATGQTAVEVA